MRILKSLFVSAAVLTASALIAQPACELTTYPTGVAFGDYSVFGSSGATLQTSFTIVVECVPPGTTEVVLRASATSGQILTREMASGAERLNYNAYLDAAGTQIFGDGSGGSFTVSATGISGPRANRITEIPVYFITSLGADAAAGLYADSLTVELTNGKGVMSATFQVTANVVPECQVSTFTLPFGNYDPVGAHLTNPLNANTTVNVFCTRGVTGQVSMSAGNNPAGTTRQLAFGANRLQYNIFTTAARDQVWNTINMLSGTSGSKLSPLGGGLIGYGQIPAGQPAVPGSYVDTLVATVTY